MKNPKELYKIVPYFVEKRGNLKMMGVPEPVEYKVVRDILVVHVKDDMSPDSISQLLQQLQVVFGEPLLLFAVKNDVSFFVAEPMTQKEVREYEEKRVRHT